MKKYFNKEFKVLITWQSIIKKINIYKKILKKNNILYDCKMPKQCFSSSDLKKYIHKYDGVICGDDEFNLDVLLKAKKLKVISKWGTGIDSIDSIAAKKMGIKVFNVKDAFTDEVATYAIGILIYLTRGLGELNINKTRKWIKYSGESLIGKNAGIVGHGRIGSKIEKYLKALGCNVFINDIKKNKKNKKNFLRFNSILAKCNYIFFAVNLNKYSRKMLTFSHKKYLKKKPIIINISRGLVLDEKFIAHCLKKKLINNVGLDVFEKEPIDQKHAFLKMKHNFYSAHNAFNTMDSVERTNKKVIENLIKGLK
jgi:D-3-phosphoglycerate dehydrogenase